MTKKKIHIVSLDEERIEGYLERAALDEGVIVPVELLPADLAPFATGERYGRFNERINHCEVRTAGFPTWFSPEKHPGHIGIIRPDMRVFLELEIDDVERAKPSTFDQQVAAIAVEAPRQGLLFG